MTRNAVRIALPLAGGASNSKVEVQLPGTDLKLSIGARAVMPGQAKDAYSMSRARCTTGGSVYQLTLNAVGANARGYWLAPTFHTAK